MSGKNIAKNKNGRFLRRRSCLFCFYFVITTKQTKTKRYGQKYIFYRTAGLRELCKYLDRDEVLKISMESGGERYRKYLTRGRICE